MYYSVDRIEGNTAVLEDDNEKKEIVSVSLLPEDTKETDILKKDENGVFIKDDEEKYRRQKEIQDLLESLKNE